MAAFTCPVVLIVDHVILKGGFLVLTIPFQRPWRVKVCSRLWCAGIVFDVPSPSYVVFLGRRLRCVQQG